MIKKLDHSCPTDAQSILDLSLLSYRVEADLLGLVDFPSLDEKREQISTYRVCSVTTAKQNLPVISLYRSEGFKSVESSFVEPTLELTTFHTG